MMDLKTRLKYFLARIVTFIKSGIVILRELYATGLTKNILAPVVSSTVGNGFVNLIEIPLNYRIYIYVRKYSTYGLSLH